MRKKTFITAFSLLLFLLMAGQVRAEAEEKCRVVSTDTKSATLKRLYVEHNAQPLLIIGGSVYYCPCGARSLGGDTEGRSLGGDTEGRSLGGDTEGRSLGGDTEGRSLGGDTEGRSLGGDTEGRSLGGDTEGRSLGGDTEGRSLGGDTEGRSIGGETTVISCSLTPACRGFVVNNTSSRTFTIFDGRSISSTKNTCIE